MRFAFLPLLLSGILTTSALAQDTRLLDCTDTSLFGTGCRPAMPVVVAEPPVAALAPVPLFPRETLAPDTPPVFVDLLHEVTPENADRFIEWQEARFEVMQRVNALLKARWQVRKGGR